MTDEQLREAVARALCTADEQNGGPPWDYVLTMGEPFVEYYYDRADAAIALMRPVIRAEALEEAAQAIEAMYGHGMTKEHAAAIRALKEKPNG